MKTLHYLPDQRDHQTDKPGLIGNLKLAHLLFLIIGGGMVINAALSGTGSGSLFILLFLVACITLMAMFTRGRYEKLTVIWTELARQTGLELVQGRWYLIGESIPPYLRGVYQGRTVCIEKIVIQKPGYEGSIPLVCTRISIDLANTYDCQLVVNTKTVRDRVLKSPENEAAYLYMDKRLKVNGYPAGFLHKVLPWISNQSALLERPKEVGMMTDSPFAFVTWSPPSIMIECSQLTYLQNGVVSDVTEQVNILNRLSGLARLAEETYHE